MTSELDKYNCEEYLNEYYSYGMFHPTEAYDLFPHEKMILNEEKEYLQIGGIWDDVDSKICYRKFKKGIWGRYNYDETYFLLADTLEEVVELWYPNNSNYWIEMNSETQWNEIKIFYNQKIEIYNWESLELRRFVNLGIENQILKNTYLKAFKNSLDISSINGFMRRPNNNMVILQFKNDTKEYCVYYKEGFFKDTFSKIFGYDEIETAMKSINEWIKKKTAYNNT